MKRLFEGISNFFARRRRHCSMHGAYEADCPACVALNSRQYVHSGTVEIMETEGDRIGADDSSGFHISSTDNASGDSSGPYSSSIFDPNTYSSSGDSSGGDGSSADSFSSYGSGADSSTGDSSSCTTSDFGGFDGGTSGGGGASGDF